MIKIRSMAPGLEDAGHRLRRGLGNFGGDKNVLHLIRVIAAWVYMCISQRYVARF